MGLIGDIYYSFRGDGARLTKDAQVEGAKAGTTLGKSVVGSFKQSWSGANIGKGLVQGLGLAGGLGAVTLISGAIGKFGDVLGDATRAAIEEERSVQKLRTALKANIPDWDGNTRAIEKTLKARMELGFSDDEQRESLARLVVSTHDVNKALAIQRTAMDLARLKGISLAEATDALVKVNAGSFRALKSLGIVLKDGATATEALAEIQKAAAGQAEDYADTVEGKLLVSQTKLGEASETLGSVTLPLLVTGMEIAADAAISYADTLDHLTHLTELTAADQQDLLGSLVDVARRGFLPAELAARGIGFAWDAMGIKIGEAADTSTDAVESMRGNAFDDLADTGVALTDVGDAADDMAKGVEKGTEKAEKSIEELRDAAASAAQQMVDDYFDPIETAADALEQHQANKAAVEERRLAKSKQKQREAARAIIESLDDQATSLVKLGSQGKLTAGQVDRFEEDVKASYKALGQKVPPELQKIIDRLRTTKQWTDKNYNVHVGITFDAAAITRLQNRLRSLYGITTRGPLRAEGGPVTAGMPYIVGEKRPELFVPETNGRIIPRVPSGLATAGGGTNNVNVTINAGGDVSPLAARRFGQAVLDVVADGLREQTARMA